MIINFFRAPDPEGEKFAKNVLCKKLAENITGKILENFVNVESYWLKKKFVNLIKFTTLRIITTHSNT